MGCAIDGLRSQNSVFIPGSPAAAFGRSVAANLSRRFCIERLRSLESPASGRCSASAARWPSAISSKTPLTSAVWIVAIIAALAACSACPVRAAELKVLSGGAMRAAVQELAGFFETSSGLKLVIEYGTVAKVAEKVTGDDPIDVAILTKPFLDELVRAGKMAGGTAAQLARVPIGLAVRQGAPKPDIKTVEAFKKTLLDAKFITHGDPSIGDDAGVHMAKTLETLGLASETRPKTRLISPPPGQSGAQFLTGLFQRGETEVAMAPISVLMETQGAEIVGLLPA